MHFLPWLGNLHHTMTHRVFMAQDWKGCASLTGAFQGFGLLRIRENKPPHLATLQRCSSPNHRPFQTSVKITIRYVFQPLKNRWASQGFITHSWPKKCFKSRKANVSQHFTIFAPSKTNVLFEKWGFRRMSWISGNGNLFKGYQLDRMMQRCSFISLWYQSKLDYAGWKLTSQKTLLYDLVWSLSQSYPFRILWIYYLQPPDQSQCLPGEKPPAVFEWDRGILTSQSWYRICFKCRELKLKVLAFHERGIFRINGVTLHGY